MNLRHEEGICYAKLSDRPQWRPWTSRPKSHFSVKHSLGITRGSMGRLRLRTAV